MLFVYRYMFSTTIQLEHASKVQCLQFATLVSILLTYRKRECGQVAAIGFEYFVFIMAFPNA